MVGLVDVFAVGILILILALVAREVIFRWRVKLRVLSGDGTLLEDSRVKVINITQGPEGSHDVDAVRMVPVDES
ncbi:MAG: hypothetical protein CMB42_01490 [Euryarchaeota archaeon]|nr:hypothetical protein [Euryarchaeota archaeon]|tara:strand:- start:64 stop:285 length:222 start_codon:yes stop_codon:yes gene_type:complete